MVAVFVQLIRDGIARTTLVQTLCSISMPIKLVLRPEIMVTFQ